MKTKLIASALLLFIGAFFVVGTIMLGFDRSVAAAFGLGALGFVILVLCFGVYRWGGGEIPFLAAMALILCEVGWGIDKLFEITKGMRFLPRAVIFLGCSASFAIGLTGLMLVAHIRSRQEEPKQAASP